MFRPLEPWAHSRKHHKLKKSMCGIQTPSNQRSLIWDEYPLSGMFGEVNRNPNFFAAVAAIDLIFGDSNNGRDSNKGWDSNRVQVLIDDGFKICGMTYFVSCLGGIGCSYSIFWIFVFPVEPKIFVLNTIDHQWISDVESNIDCGQVYTFLSSQELITFP